MNESYEAALEEWKEHHENAFNKSINTLLILTIFSIVGYGFGFLFFGGLLIFIIHYVKDAQIGGIIGIVIVLLLVLAVLGASIYHLVLISQINKRKGEWHRSVLILMRTIGFNFVNYMIRRSIFIHMPPNPDDFV